MTLFFSVMFKKIIKQITLRIEAAVKGHKSN